MEFYKRVLEDERLLDIFIMVALYPPQEEFSDPSAVELGHFPKGELKNKDDRAMLSQIPQFCFPDCHSFPKKALHPESRFFTFVVTDTAGKKRFAYCYRRLRSREKTLLDMWPIAYCIVTKYSYYCFYEEFLQAVSKVGSTENIYDLVSFVHSSAHPTPGESLHYITMDGEMEFNFRRPFELEYVNGFLNFYKLLYYFDPFTLICVFCSMLLERRIIFFSSRPRILCDCILAASCLLSPFTWQYVFIPILPPRMIDLVCAPMPFICGVLNMHLELVMSQPMEEVVFVDIDTCSISETFDYRILPYWALDHLILGLQVQFYFFFGIW
eukprot:TRINITY_DN14739_c0_g2_i1.p1 TRINITY_DN14739_c0_g2~~TRINITY_DN14739_c0_g2_i1.p1  ORF type:complete len:326 (+),score=42.45 TRINITY_DN14739_c0_g2_i1:264-1241(+)